MGLITGVTITFRHQKDARWLKIIYNNNCGSYTGLVKEYLDLKNKNKLLWNISLILIMIVLLISNVSSLTLQNYRILFINKKNSKNWMKLKVTI